MLTIAISCEGLSNEAARISVICYTLLSELPVVPESDLQATVRQELLLIADQTAVVHPKVSAAGFFEVNLGMMGFIFTSVTSYIIVSVQFLQK